LPYSNTGIPKFHRIDLMRRKISKVNPFGFGYVVSWLTPPPFELNSGP
jgi:hypothetical protein